MISRSAVLIACSVLGCRGPSSAGVHLADRAAPLDVAPVAREAGAGPVTTRSPSLPDDGIERVFKGQIGDDLPVVFRLRRQGRAVTGRYFYEKMGSDLELEGSIGENDRIAIDERSGARKTGRIEGTFGADGAFSGSWKDATKERSLAIVLRAASPSWNPGSPVPLYKKHVHSARKPLHPSPMGMLKECTLDADYPEVAGVFDPASEAKLNAKLHSNLAVPEPTCDTPESGELKYTVPLNRAGVLSVVFEYDWCCGAHPSITRDFVNLVVPRAETITLAGLLSPGARPKLVGLARPIVTRSLQEIDSLAVNDVLDQLTNKPADFSIEEKGLRLSAFNSQPHVIQALFADGFFLPYAKLAGLLATPGPLDSLTRK